MKNSFYRIYGIAFLSSASERCVVVVRHLLLAEVNKNQTKIYDSLRFKMNKKKLLLSLITMAKLCLRNVGVEMKGMTRVVVKMRYFSRF